MTKEERGKIPRVYYVADKLPLNVVCVEVAYPTLRQARAEVAETQVIFKGPRLYYIPGELVNMEEVKDNVCA